jgi:hypothetical protein
MISLQMAQREVVHHLGYPQYVDALYGSRIREFVKNATKTSGDE